MAATSELCPDCAAFMDKLLRDRISAILRTSGDDARKAEDSGMDPEPIRQSAESHCFHLMELQRIVRGEKTCGVFDDYGVSNGDR